MSIRGVIFDLGDTLMYFNARWDDAVNRATAGEMAAFFTCSRINLDEAAYVHRHVEPVTRSPRTVEDVVAVLDFSWSLC